MRTTPVDERNSSREENNPVFWVFLWSRPQLPEGTDPARIGWSNESHELTGCDVHQAIAWARASTPENGVYTLHLAHEEIDGATTLIRIAGTEPTRE
ncbi:hypothetical protein J2S53_000521 [Actinopolyspora lacussalsi]|nr:hypothetical protein [Actinopolyspora lacussalsi]